MRRRLLLISILLLVRLRILASDPREREEQRDGRGHPNPPPVEPCVARTDLAGGDGLLGPVFLERSAAHRLVAESDELGVGALADDPLAVTPLQTVDVRHNLRAAARLDRRRRHRLNDRGLHFLLAEGHDPLRVGGELSVGLGGRRQEAVEEEEDNGWNHCAHEHFSRGNVVRLAEVHPEHLDVLNWLDTRRAAHPGVHEPCEQGQEQSRDTDVPAVFGEVHHPIDDRKDHCEAINQSDHRKAPRKAIFQLEFSALALIRHEGPDERLGPVGDEVTEDPREERDSDTDQTRPHVPPREVGVRADRAKDRNSNG